MLKVPLILKPYFQLFPHIQVEATLFWKGAELELTFAVKDLQHQLLHPRSENKTPLRCHELWKHTCFEIFLKIPHTSSYFEINQTSAYHWNVYEFTNYREGMKESENLYLKHLQVLESEIHKMRLQSVYQWSPAFLKMNSTETLQVGITAVLETHDCKIDYYALTHANSKPDFHHFDSFIYSLHPSEI